MAELGKFTADEFKVLKPQQMSEPTPEKTKDDGEPQESPEKAEDEEIEEIPLKDKEQILDDLKKSGTESETRNEEKTEPEQYDIGDKAKPKEDKEKEGKDKSEEEGKKEEEGKEEKGEPMEKTDRQKKIDEQSAKDKERREKVRSKNVITEKINSYNTILVKHQDKLPNKVKNSLESAIKELEILRTSIKTD